MTFKHARARIAGGIAMALIIVSISTACTRQTVNPITLAVSASAAEPAPTVSPFIEILTDHGLAAKHPGDGRVDIITFGRNTVDKVDLTPMRNDEVEAIPERATQEVDRNMAQLIAAMAQMTAGTDGLDTLALLDRAAEHTPEGGTILLQSSGIQTIDPLDLRTLGWDYDIAKVVADLDARGLLPDLTGRSVIFAGLGVALGTQPQPARPGRVHIEETWLAICRAGHATSCATAEADLDLVAPASAAAVPIVPVADVDTTCSPTTLSVPAAAAFDGDSASLRQPSADAVLAPVANKLVACPTGVTVSVTGHAADVTPGQLDAVELSIARARAVANRLTALGAPTGLISVRGVGDAQPKVDNWRAGQFDESLASLNRRVDITITA